MTTKTQRAEIRALIQAQILLPDYAADPIIRRRVGKTLAESCEVRANEKDGLV